MFDFNRIDNRSAQTLRNPWNFYLFIPSMITVESHSFREVTGREDAVRCKQK